MFSKDQRVRILAPVFKGLRFLDLGFYFQRTKGFLGFGSCFQRPRSFGSWLIFSNDQGFFRLWLMFSEGQRFWIPAHGFKDLGFLDLGSCFQRTKSFLGFVHVFRGIRVFWALAHVFRGPKILDPGSCFQRTKGSGSWLVFSEDQGEDQRFCILAHVFRGLGFFGLWIMFSED